MKSCVTLGEEYVFVKGQRTANLSVHHEHIKLKATQKRACYQLDVS